MKRLQQHEPYPAELWEKTDAPSWSAERVWQQIEARQEPVQPKARWMIWLCMLALVLGSVRWLSEEEALAPAEAQPEVTTSMPKTQLQPAEVKFQTTVIEKAPEVLPPPELQRIQPFRMEVPVPPPPALPVELLDTMSAVVPVPIAQEELLPQLPAAPVASPLQLLPESIAELPADTRVGTKLKLKIPEIPSADARQGAFVKRLWQQYKRLNTEGEIDWVELGIQPNGDGTFSILPQAPKNTTKPN